MARGARLDNRTTKLYITVKWNAKIYGRGAETDEVVCDIAQMGVC